MQVRSIRVPRDWKMSEEEARKSAEPVSEPPEPAPPDQSWLVMEDVRSVRLDEYEASEPDTSNED